MTIGYMTLLTFQTALTLYASYLSSIDPESPEFLVTLNALENDFDLESPRAALGVVRDPVLSVGVSDVELPFAFRTQIKNLGPTTDTFMLALGNIPTGFTARTSVPSITLESGQTGEVGVCLQPIDAVPPVGTDLRFDVTATSRADPSVSLTTTSGIVVPPVEGLTMAFGPKQVATEPGVPVQTTLTLSSVGSGPIDAAEITVDPSAGLTVTGITSPMSLAVGETLTWPVTLTPAANTPVNQSLSALVTARFGADLAGDPLRVTAAVGMRTTSAAAQPAYGAADAALNAGRPNLARTLSQLGDAINTLVGAPDDPRHRDRLLAIIDRLLGQLSGPALEAIIAALTGVRADIAEATPAGLADALAALTAALAPLDSFLRTDPAALPFELGVWPASITAEPGRPARFSVQLTNTGTETVTYDLALGDLPTGVTGTVTPASVTLGPGEATSVDGGIPLSVSVTPTPDRIDSIEWTLSARPSGSDRAKTAQGLVLARAETLQVLRVAATPGFIDAGGTVQVHAALLSAVNREQSVSVQYRVLDRTGNAVFTSAPRAVATSVVDTLTTLDLGTLDTTGFAEGQYRILVSATGADGASVPTAEGALFIGSPLLAQLTLDPQLVPPGDAVTQVSLHLTNRTLITDPDITLIGQVATGSSARSLAVQGDHAYVCGTEDVTIVDVSDPRNAAVLGAFAGDSINNLGSSYCRIIDDQLIINAQETQNASSLRTFVFDVTEPASPSLLGTKSLPYRFIGGWYADGGAVFMPFGTLSRSFFGGITQKGNFAAFDFSTPANPTLIGSLYGFSGLDGAGKVRFNDQPALTIVDVNDPLQPHVRSITVPASLGEIQRRDNILFTPTGAGLSFYDIGEVLGLTYSAEVRIPKGTGVEIVPDSFNVPPTRIETGDGYDTLVWERASNRDRIDETLTWSMAATGLAPAEARTMTLASRVGFTTSDDSVGEVVLPGTALVAEQTIGITPTARQINPGETAHFILHIDNPAGRSVDYRLSLTGVLAP